MVEKCVYSMQINSINISVKELNELISIEPDCNSSVHCQICKIFSDLNKKSQTDYKLAVKHFGALLDIKSGFFLVESSGKLSTSTSGLIFKML